MIGNAKARIAAEISHQRALVVGQGEDLTASRSESARPGHVLGASKNLSVAVGLTPMATTTTTVTATAGFADPLGEPLAASAGSGAGSRTRGIPRCVATGGMGSGR